MLDLDFEKQFQENGYKVICGCDEAGRGPLAGPVVAAACILPDGIHISGLDDSKNWKELFISEKKLSFKNFTTFLIIFVIIFVLVFVRPPYYEGTFEFMPSK